MTYAKDVPLTRFPSHERRLAIDGDSYEDLVQPVAVEIAGWLTDCFASSHQARDHLPRDILAEALLPLVDKNNPVWDVGGIEHEFINPSKTCVIDTAQASRNNMTHRFQAPLSGCFIGEHQPIPPSKNGK